MLEEDSSLAEDTSIPLEEDSSSKLLDETSSFRLELDFALLEEDFADELLDLAELELDFAEELDATEELEEPPGIVNVTYVVSEDSFISVSEKPAFVPS